MHMHGERVYPTCLPMQAARVSAACRTLKQTAAIIRERPFQYAKVPQLDLDSFVIYTSGVHLRVSVQCGTHFQSTSNCSVVFCGSDVLI